MAQNSYYLRINVARTELCLLPKVINGSIAGIVGVSCVFPIDLVKTRLQNQCTAPNGQRVYKGLVDCAFKTLRQEGLLGMYRGAGVNMLLITPEKSIKLVGNDIFRYLLKTDRNTLTLPREMMAGAGAGLCQTVITTPMELLKIQLQDAGRVALQKSSNKINTMSFTNTITGALPREAATKLAKSKTVSATDIATRLIRERGIRGLYRGCFATMLRDVTFSVIYFPLFAHLRSRGNTGDKQALFYHNFISGCIAGSVAAVSVNPMDVVKTRLQLIAKGRGEVAYKGVVDCFRKTYQSEGIAAFFKGASCRVLVISPLFGIAQTVYYLGVAEFLLGLEKE